MVYYYNGHCEDCCRIYKSKPELHWSSEHYDGATLSAEITKDKDTQIFKAKKDIILHERKTRHKNYLLETHEDRERAFDCGDYYNYTPITITRKERKDIEYIIKLEEQGMQRDYSKSERRKKIGK